MAILYQKMNKVLRDNNITMAEIRKTAEIVPNAMVRIKNRRGIY